MRKFGRQLMMCTSSLWASITACVVDNPSFDQESDSVDGATTTDMNQNGMNETDDSSDTEIILGPAQFDEGSVAGCEVFECVSYNEDATHRLNYGPTRDYRYAAKIVVGEELLVIGAEVMTGKRTGKNRLSIWRSKNDLPNREISGGSWEMNPELGWQGAFFSEVAMIDEGELFWIVWKPINGAEGTIAINGIGVDAVYQSPGGPWYRSGYIPYMVRVYCCAADE